MHIGVSISQTAKDRFHVHAARYQRSHIAVQGASVSASVLRHSESLCGLPHRNVSRRQTTMKDGQLADKTRHTRRHAHRSTIVCELTCARVGCRGELVCTRVVLLSWNSTTPTPTPTPTRTSSRGSSPTRRTRAIS